MRYWAGGMSRAVDQNGAWQSRGRLEHPIWNHCFIVALIIILINIFTQHHHYLLPNTDPGLRRKICKSFKNWLSSVPVCFNTALCNWCHGLSWGMGMNPKGWATFERKDRVASDDGSLTHVSATTNHTLLHIYVVLVWKHTRPTESSAHCDISKSHLGAVEPPAELLSSKKCSDPPTSLQHGGRLVIFLVFVQNSFFL